MNFETAKKYVDWIDEQSGQFWTDDTEMIIQVMEDYAKMYHERKLDLFKKEFICSSELFKIIADRLLNKLGAELSRITKDELIKIISNNHKSNIMTEVSDIQENNKENPPLGEVFNKKVRIKPNITTGKFEGRYSKENQEWLEKNVGTIVNAYRDGLNYYKLENGFICHIYECTDL